MECGPSSAGSELSHCSLCCEGAGHPSTERQMPELCRPGVQAVRLAQD